MNTEKIKEIIRKNENKRYDFFTLMLENPVKLKDMLKNKDVQVVQLFSLQTCKAKDGKEYLIGFCGQLEWKNNTAISLDGDTYNDDMHVYGYQWWKNEEHGITGLDILVGDDW